MSRKINVFAGSKPRRNRQYLLRFGLVALGFGLFLSVMAPLFQKPQPLQAYTVKRSHLGFGGLGFIRVWGLEFRDAFCGYRVYCLVLGGGWDVRF